jgi:hypothetical protein
VINRREGVGDDAVALFPVPLVWELGSVLRDPGM